MNEESSFNAAVETRLDEITRLSFFGPGRVERTPPGAYAIRFPGMGIASRERHDGAASRLTLDYTVMVVSNSVQGVIDAVSLVRSKLAGWRPTFNPSIDPLNETVTGMILPDTSVPGDFRYSCTLLYSTEMSRTS